MKVTALLLLTAFFGGIALAQEALPMGITRLDGEIVLRFTPKFESRCTIKKFQKLPGSFFGNRTTEISATGVDVEPSGLPALWMDSYVGSNYIRMIFGLNEDGSRLSNDVPSWKSDMQLTEADRIAFPKLLQEKFGVFKKALEVAVGIPLRHGSVIQRELCELNPDAKAQGRVGNFAVIGVAAIKGRESVVVAGDETETCVLPNGQFTMQSKGWFAIDRQSGLTVDQSLANRIANAPTGAITSTYDQECAITGTPIKGGDSRPTVSPEAKSAEQRLTELKSLFDEGLITQEQYEQKRAEIVKSL